MISKSVTVATTTTAVLLDTEHDGSSNRPCVMIVKAPSTNTADVLIGGPTTGAQLFTISAGESLAYPMIGADELYAHVAAATQPVQVIWND